MELYFEIEKAELEYLDVEFVHKIIEQPWVERLMRFYDPDNYILKLVNL